MEQVFRSLTDRGVSGYKKFSASFCNSQTLAAELFPQNEWQRSIPLGRTPSNKSERPSVWLFIKTLLHTRRTNQTMTRMTTIVPTTPIPNIVPPVGNVGHLEHFINDGRASFRL